MKINLVQKGVNLSERKVQKIETCFSKFDKFFRSEPTCKLLVSKSNDEGSGIVLDASIMSGKKVYRASADSADFFVAVDILYEKFKKQIRREKDRSSAERKERLILRTEDA